ncbi:uncharacterized protein [Lepeophtheirus salmonis]|uniref:uncharacterized protein n=1 Tax=Lepeophtheirus salmonis TaxID=72036 RepID=UPI001AE4C121|nr:uncharacterized protein LOC121132455 [Lepeophtheirus salmonis]
MDERRKSEALYIDYPRSCSSQGHALMGTGMEGSGGEEETLLILAPFSPLSKMDFGEVKLGKCCLRKLRCCNTGSKSLCVSMEKFPKEEKGFEMDFKGPFTLGAQEEAFLNLGWVPQSGGALRETITIKCSSFKTSLQITGFCLDPQTEKLRKMSFRRPVLKSIHIANTKSGSKVPLPPNPIIPKFGVSPPKRKMKETDSLKVPKSPAQPMNRNGSTQNDIVSWSPQPVHFMDGSFLRKGEESKLIETEKAHLPSWTNSSLNSRKIENDWTAVDENFIRKRQEQIGMNNESCMPANGNSLAISDVSIDFKHPFPNLVPESCPMIKKTVSNRRDTYVSVPKQMETSDIVSASCPKDSKFVLSEIECVKAKLEESGIKGVADKIDKVRPPSKLFRDSTDILSDIQTNLVCSPVRSSAIIDKLQLSHLSDIDVCLDLSPEVQNIVNRAPSKVTSGIDLSFKLDLDLSLSPKTNTVSNIIDLNLDIDLDLSPKCHIPQEHKKESPKYSTSPTFATHLNNNEYHTTTVEKCLETPFSTESFVISPTSEEIECSKAPHPDLDKISFLVAEHLRMDNKKDHVRVEVNDSNVKDSFVFSVPSVSPKGLSNDDKVNHKKMDEISLLVAQHLKNVEEKKGKGLSSDILNVQSLISDEVKKYDYKEDTIYETNLHECKESFLQTTINETSFVPIPEKGYCSTAVKDKTREKSLHNQSEERSSTFCRDLFGSKNNSNNSPNEVVISESAEHNLSLLLPSPSEDLKVSSETFTMSPEISKLTTINEDHEDLRSNSLSKNLSKEMSVSEYKMTDSTDNNSPPNLKLNPIKNEVFSSNSSKTTKFSSEQLSSSVETKSVRNVREKYSTMKSRISNPSGGNSSSSTLRPSPLKKGSPFKRRYPDSKTLKPNSRSGLTLIKMAAASNPKLHSNSKTSLVRHPNLFSAKNLYYDERWMEKQKKGFTKWLNFILTPSDEVMDMSSHNKKTDAAKLWSACTKDVKVPRAPTREVMSFRAYTMEKEMNSLRISAVRLWQSPQVIKVITKLEIEIEKKKLYVRDDRCLNKDLGIKQSFLSLLLNYNPLWLRIGLETIYGEVLQVSGNSDIVRISRFIITRLLSNPSILETYSHPTVPHLYKPGHEEALKKFTLKMFLRLIFFLDFAKNNRLIKHDPCLFCKDSDFKMSRDLLVEFSKKFLACEGDITKHLRCIGYDVNHKQTIFDEFDYAVINFPTDVRCGARLCRVLELLLDGDYTSKLRIPAHSRLQKIHNVSIALKALTSSSAGLPKSIDSKDIVNGYVEKILSLIWHIIFGLVLVKKLPVFKWEKEIARLLKSLKVHAVVKESPAASGLQFYEEKETNVPNEESEPTTKYVLKWARLVCAHYGIEIENLTVSFSDGRALCFLIHHYYPSFLSKEEIMMNTTVSSVAMSNVTTSIDDNRKANDELLNNEKKNFKTFLDKVNELGGVPILIRSVDMSNTIPDRKVTLTFLIYLASRLLDLFEEIHAAKKIQSAWRRTKKMREKRCLEEKYSTIDSKGS